MVEKGGKKTNDFEKSAAEKHNISDTKLNKNRIMNEPLDKRWALLFE